MKSKTSTRIRRPATRCALLVLACLCPWCVASQAQTPAQSQPQILDTPSFTILIEVRCPEGEVTCRNVIYRGENKRTKKKLQLRGRTAHSLCADRVTPCRFLGYAFRNGRFTYFVSERGELVVQNGPRIVVQQSGTWQ